MENVTVKVSSTSPSALSLSPACLSQRCLAFYLRARMFQFQPQPSRVESYFTTLWPGITYSCAHAHLVLWVLCAVHPPQGPSDQQAVTEKTCTEIRYKVGHEEHDFSQVANWESLSMGNAPLPPPHKPESNWKVTIIRPEVECAYAVRIHYVCKFKAGIKPK